MVRLGDVLVSAVGASPAESSAFEVVHDAVLAGLRFGTTHPRTRQVIEITARNPTARQAHRSRRVDIEDRLTEAFAARTRNETKDDVRPKMMAILTITVSDLAMISWFKGEFEEYSKAADNVLAMLQNVLCAPVEEHTPSK
jgi:hypothetical protein